MRWLLPLLAACSSTPKPETPVAGDPEFPRIASYFIETYVDDDARAVMASSDLAIIDAEAAALDREPLEALRTSRPDLVLLAYLTSEEVPRDATEERPLANARFSRIDPSAWLVEPGATLTTAIDATTTKLRVSDAGAFTVHRPKSDFYGEDEPTYLLVDGEHMKLVSIAGDTLTVERGFRSPAVAHTAGARVASHVVFFGGTWMLDITSPAWRDLLADEAAGMVETGPWTGVFLDVCFEDISWLNDGVLDLDRDGILDRDASERWSAGMGQLVDTLRAKLGPSVPIISNPGAQDCPHPNLDGILMEGWPIGMPPAYLDFEVGAARYEEWARKPFTIANAFSPKIGFGTIEEGADEAARTDYAAMRFGLGVALMHDGYYAYDNGVFGHYVAWHYDEYDGAGRGRHWLGRARGAAQTEGTLRIREFEHGLAVVNLGEAPVTFAAPGYRKLAGTQDPAHNDGGAADALVVPARDAYLLSR
jgi:hypothetical protein